MEHKDIEPTMGVEDPVKRSPVSLNNILDSTADLIWIVDTETYSLAMFNRSFAEFYAEVLSIPVKPGMCPEDMLTTESARAWRNLYAQVLESGSCFTEHSIGGKIFHCNVSVIKTNAGASGISVFARDVTQQKAAEEVVKKREQLARVLLDATSDIAHLVDEQGKIIDLNLATAKALSSPRDALIGTSIFDRFPPEVAEQRRAIVRQAISQKKSLSFEDNRGGRTIEISVHPVRTLDVTSKWAVVFAHDITERKAAETTLRESENRYKQIFEHAPLAINIVQGNQIVYANPAYTAMFGFSSLEELKKEPLLARAAPEWRSRILENLDRRLKGLPVPTVYEAENLRKDGTRFPVLMFFTTISLLNGPAILGFFLDITEPTRVKQELERSKQELASLGAHLNAALEAERTTIAREIHDELGQSLTALQIDLNWMKKRLPESDKAVLERSDRMMKLVDRTIHNVQKISSALRPGILDDLGLFPALEWLAEDFQRRTNIECGLKFPINTQVPPNVASHLFRIVQEALTNVSRHAGATDLRININTNKDHLVLNIRDNGRGIRDQEINSLSSFGLMGMRERARQLGGDFAINGVDGKGTNLTVTVPLWRDDDGESLSLR